MPPADPPPADEFPAGQTGDMRDVLLSPPTGAKPATAPAGRWEPPTAEELQKLLPQYEITSLLGRGGMGAVYKGRQIALDRPVAIKILSNTLEEADASFAERFKNEARALGKLSHPGIVGVYDFGEAANGLLYIVMEFIDGTDVAKMLAQQKRLHTEHAMAITAHVCDALAYAHERGIIHRDIKPANIMVGYDGVVKVADFGLAKMTHSQNSGLTQSGMAMGTLHYMAPEALMLGSAVDHRADIYAVGVMLYQMLTGKLPQGLFEMPSLQVPGLDPRYDGIISKAMREDRDLRYPRVLDMRHDLDAILTQPVVKVEPSADKAPAALQTQARPQRPGGQPHRPPQPEVIVRTEKKGAPLLWTAIVALAALAGWLYVKKSAPEGLPSASVPVVGSPPVADTSPAPAVNDSSSAITTNPAQATKDRPFVNSLGMKFVPVPGTKVLFCIHETRYRDFAVYAENDNSLAAYWKQQSHDGLKLGDNGKDHPVVNVSKKESQGFCQWLSQKESHTYRLPKDAEWSSAAGVAEAEQRSEGMLPSTVAIKQLGFPWGNTWPPPSGSGNYSDESRRRTGRGQFHIAAYDDGYPTTSPVMRFPPNHLGIYDMGGNVWEWCEDKFHSTGEEIGLRGGSWHDGQEGAIRLSRRTLYLPDQRNAGNGFRCVVEIENAGVTVTKANSPGLSASSSQAKPPTQNSQNASGEITMTKEQDSRQASFASPTTWTDTKGRSITATFKAIASGNVLLDIAGKVTPVPLTTLSAASQKLARDYHDQPNPATTNDPAQATKDRPFVNTLGMKFVPVPGTKVLFCIHETRRVDYAAFTKTNPGVGGNWESALLDDRPLVGEPFDQHPIAKVSRPDAESFCKWLSVQSTHRYRLPTDAEWSLAADFDEPRSASETPDDLNDKAVSGSAARIYPWGTEWPPPARGGNYSGQFTPAVDSFPTTAPVMTFQPNKHGLFDIGGNLWEWVSDRYWSKDQIHGTLRGGGWSTTQEHVFRSGSRFGGGIMAMGKEFGFRVVIELPAASSASSVPLPALPEGGSSAAPMAAGTAKSAPASMPVPAAVPAVSKSPPSAAPVRAASNDFNAGQIGDTRVVDLGSGVKLTLCYCPPGSFTMGSPPSEAGRGNDEDPVSVRITQGFWLGQYEVTQAQWVAVMGRNPSRFKGDALPVEQVSWEDAQAFIGKLNQTAALPVEWKYALPTEAQWEYACRAGTEGPYAGTGQLEEMGWYDGNSGAKTHSVGAKRANAWGLHDMHGNVWEWCADWYGAKLAGGTDLAGVPSGSERVYRGGSWYRYAEVCRAAFRSKNTPGLRSVYLGFRLAAVPAGAR